MTHESNPEKDLAIGDKPQSLSGPPQFGLNDDQDLSPNWSSRPSRPLTKRTRGFIERGYNFVYRNSIEPLLISKNPPGYDALSVSLGLAVGFMVPVGGHLLCLALLRTLFRFNYLVAAGFTMGSNPLNMIPLYYGYYWLGSTLLGKSLALNFDAFEKLMDPIVDKAYFWEALSAFMALGWEILIRWSAAAFLSGVFLGVVGYVVTYKIQRQRCRKAARRLGMHYKEFLEHLRDASYRETT